MNRVYFHRTYKGFTGGHLKVWDYYNHVQALPEVEAGMYFDSVVWDERNPWLNARENILTEWCPKNADVLFLAGKDWRAISAADQINSSIPIINFIQSLGHARELDERYSYLSNRAVRICISPEVATAIGNTGRVNGPIYTIPNGVNQEALPEGLPDAQRDIDVLIVGIKQRRLARMLKMRTYLSLPNFQGFRKTIEVLSKPVCREVFLDKMRRAKTTVFLPNRSEGFYLPALEGMLLGTTVICPDCVGNRGFCISGRTCLSPEYTPAGLIEAIRQCLRSTPAEIENLRAPAREIAKKHSLTRERASFAEILQNIQTIW